MGAAENGNKAAYILGAGGHAGIVRDIMDKAGVAVSAFIHEKPATDSLFGKPLISLNDFIEAGQHADADVAIAVGDNMQRHRLAAILSSHSTAYGFPSLVDASAVISPSAKIGNGVVICPGAIVNSNARIGDYCIVNSGAIVEHDVSLGNYCSVAPGAILAGGVEVGEGAYVGVGAVVRERICIGDHAVLGAGGVAVSSIAPNSVSLGVPARHVRSREANDPIYR